MRDLGGALHPDYARKMNYDLFVNTTAQLYASGRFCRLNPLQLSLSLAFVTCMQSQYFDPEPTFDGFCLTKSASE